MNRLLLTLGVLLLCLSACVKTDSPVSAEEDLRSGTWRRTFGTVTSKDPLTRGDSTRVIDQIVVLLAQFPDLASERTQKSP